jgi:predicted extracellular nuclease
VAARRSIHWIRSTTCPAQRSVPLLFSQIRWPTREILRLIWSNYTFSFTTNAVCGDPATFIHDVQGPGFVSPIVGDIVTVEGVVVGDFQEGNELNGFFIQEEFDDFDSDDNTSEGVFIFEGSFAGPDVNEGELVRVTGEVDEFKTLTQLKNIANVLPCDYAPDSYGPIDVTLPEETDGDLEKVEGMNINVTNTMSVAQNFFLGRYGQLTLSSDLTNRLFQPTNQVLPNIMLGTCSSSMTEWT